MQTRNAPPLIEVTLHVPRYPHQTFADRLQAYRCERGWRQIDVAKAIGVNKDTLRNGEAGRCEPRLETLGAKGVAVLQQVLGGAQGDGGGVP